MESPLFVRPKNSARPIALLSAGMTAVGTRSGVRMGLVRRSMVLMDPTGGSIIGVDIATAAGVIGGDVARERGNVPLRYNNPTADIE
jgi:hypothetical protein